MSWRQCRQAYLNTVQSLPGSSLSLLILEPPDLRIFGAGDPFQM